MTTLSVLEPQASSPLISVPVIESGQEKVLEETRAFLAHELRHVTVPLEIVNRWLQEALAQNRPDNDKTAEYAALIGRQTERLHRLTNRYLAYAQPLVLRPAPTEMASFLSQSLAASRAEFLRRQIKLVISGSGGAAQARIDRGLMGEALRELWLNALEAMEDGGTLRINARREKERVIVTVGDTGAGIEPQHLPRVFELGFTTRLGRTVAGVGLALARRIIRAHGGEITLANNSAGQGALATILLPAADTGIGAEDRHGA